MKNYFIMNPVSGDKNTRKKFRESLALVTEEYQIIETGRPGDARNFAKDIASSAADHGEKVRIFACGGDGTVNEVINGAIGHEGVEIGVIPLGTGNDFIRNFGQWEQYMDVSSYIKCGSTPVDAICYEATMNDETITGYCVNMFNIGLDCNVVDMTEKVKKVPFINGSMSYLLSVFIKFIEKKGTNLRITYDDGTLYDDKLLLIMIGNGCYCGGGIKGLPLASYTDGLMDASLIKNVTRRQFLQLFPLYTKGEHLDHKLVTEKKILDYKQCSAMEIEANDATVKICIDGEITSTKKLKLHMCPGAFNFIAPGL